jgi:hypothetical protein
MEFTLKNNKNNISISKELLENIINILDKVECTCIWSDRDQQYIKVNDIPKSLVDELIFNLNYNKLRA